MLFYGASFLFVAAIVLSFEGALSKALLSPSEEVAQRAYDIGLWIKPALTSVCILLLLHHTISQKKLSFGGYWHLYTLTVLFCLTLGLTAGLVPVTLATTLEREK